MNGIHLGCERKLWVGYCEEWQIYRSDESGKEPKVQSADGKHVYHLDDAFDSLMGTWN